MEGVLQEVRELVEYPLTHPEIYCHLGVEPPRGLLLHPNPNLALTLTLTPTLPLPLPLTLTPTLTLAG